MPFNENVNLEEQPNVIRSEHSEEISVGDTHGNFLKKLYELVQNGILELADKGDYQRLCEIYRALDVTKITSEDIKLNKEAFEGLKQEFDGIIKKSKINKEAGLTRYIGDELCDRGGNDYFSLKLFEKLGEDGAPFEILASDHGMEFWEAYQNDFTTDNLVISGPQRRSLENLIKLIKGGIVDKDEIISIIEKYYKPNLKLISYSVKDEPLDKIEIFTHTIIGFESIQAVAEYYGIDYKDNTVTDLCDTIDAINARFAWDIALGNMKSAKCIGDEERVLYPEDSKSIFSAVSSTDYPKIKYPVQRIIWHRVNDLKLFQEEVAALKAQNNKYYVTSFIHGHEGATSGIVKKILLPIITGYLHDTLEPILGKMPTLKGVIFDWVAAHDFRLNAWQDDLNDISKKYLTECESKIQLDEKQFSDFFAKAKFRDKLFLDKSNQIIREFLYRYENAASKEKKALVSVTPYHQNTDNDAGHAQVGRTKENINGFEYQGGDFHVYAAKKGDRCSPKNETLSAKGDQALPQGVIQNATNVLTKAYGSLLRDVSQFLGEGGNKLSQWPETKIDKHVTDRITFLTLLQAEIKKYENNPNFSEDSKLMINKFEEKIKVLNDRIQEMDGLIKEIDFLSGEFQKFINKAKFSSIPVGIDEKKLSIVAALERINVIKYDVINEWIIKNEKVEPEKLFKYLLEYKAKNGDGLEQKSIYDVLGQHRKPGFFAPKKTASQKHIDNMLKKMTTLKK